MKKYEIVSDQSINVYGKTLYRIRAFKSFGNVKSGDLGGFIEKETNLSHDGDAWVYGDARVCGDAWVYGNARVYGDAWVYGNARISGNVDYICFKGFGSECRNTTIFRTEDDICVSCGCFTGNLQEFESAVHKTHSGTKYEKEYMAVIELAKIHFEI